jgi:YbbR domain-containing protein
VFSSTTVKYFSNRKKPGKTKAFFICLLIAAFLWLVHSLNTTYTYTFRVPVQFSNLPVNKKPLMQLPEALYVDAKESGLKLSLILLNKPFKPLVVDFNTLEAVNRNQNYVLSASDLNFKKLFKFDARVVKVSPDTLYFSEKTGYQKIVPVKIPLYIKCQQGFDYKRPVITPNFITIWGDTSLIGNIDTIYTQPLTLNNLNENVSSNISFIRPDAEVYTSANSAHIFIEVARLVEQTITLPVTDVRAQAGNVVNIYPNSVRVRFTSMQNTLDAGDTVLFQASIDSRKINRRSKKCPVFISEMPPNITIMDIEPKEVEILIFRNK